MGGWDLAAGDWDRELFGALGLGDVALAGVRDHRAVVGEYRGLPVHVAVGDQQASLLGVFLEEGELSLNVATGSQVSRIAPPGEQGAGQRRPFFGRTLRTVTHIPAGRSLNVLVALVTELGGEEDPWPEIERRAAAAGDTGLEVDLSFFSERVRGPGPHRRHRGVAGRRHAVPGAFRGMASHYGRAAALIGAGDARAGRPLRRPGPALAGAPRSGGRAPAARAADHPA